jgi:hypothetical protein
VGALWPVPTWNLRRAKCQTLQTAASVPAGLSASIALGMILFAMVGDQSLRKLGTVVQNRIKVPRVS